MGRSLGSASTCEIISNHENRVDGCIIESGFATEIPLMKILYMEPSDIGYEGCKDAEFVILRSDSANVGNAVTVNYSIGGSATNGTDYTAILASAGSLDAQLST